jgi:hypothetical protein
MPPHVASDPTPNPPDVSAIQSLDRECYLLRLRSETFKFELERERQVRLGVGTSLPSEWFAYLERERQEILDKIHQMECIRNDESIAPGKRQIDPPPGSSTNTMCYTPSNPCATYRHQSIPQSTRIIGEYATILNSTNNVRPPCQHQESFHCPALSDMEGTLALTSLMSHA